MYNISADVVDLFTTSSGKHEYWPHRNTFETYVHVSHSFPLECDGFVQIFEAPHGAIDPAENMMATVTLLYLHTSVSEVGRRS